MCLDTSSETGSRVTTTTEPNKQSSASDNNMGDSDLRMHQLAGGNIIELAPVFSSDAESILLVWKNIVRVYQVATGAWLRDLEKSDQKLIAIAFDRNNSNLLYGCSETGAVIVWKWRSGVKEKRVQLRFPNAPTTTHVHTFNVIPNDDMETAAAAEGQSQLALVSYFDQDTQKVKIETFDLETGNAAGDEFEIPLLRDHQVAVSRFNFFATVHSNQLHIGFLRNSTVSAHENQKRRPFTRVVCHPTEPVLATGDRDGQIRLWRNVYSQDRMICTLYHWHATPINTIAFSEFGGHFYSGAKEFVLVKWTIDRPENKVFLPRLRGSPRQITLGPQNNNIALALSDNQIQLLGANFELSAVVQSFTYIHDDETGLGRFPAGLRLNPRNQCLVLNGRIGQLQFYSTQSQSLLYNLDITTENALAAEHDKVIFNTRVTKVAISEDWLVTSECFDDQQRSVQLRMKFWRFDEQRQNYSLNTNVMMPHEQDVTALELSTVHKAESVYCASAGGDRVLKLWTNNKEVYGKGNVWSCVSQRSYKGLAVNSLCFSRDGSVLIAGFGRHVVIFKGTNLRDIRCVLTAPTGMDGAISRIGVVVPKGEGKTPKKTNKARKESATATGTTAAEMQELVTRYLSMTGEEDAKEKAELRKRIYGNQEKETPSTLKPLAGPLPEGLERRVFEKIYDSLDLDVEQKVKCFNGLGLDWGVDEAYAEQREELYVRFHAQDAKVEEAKAVLGKAGNLKHLRESFQKMAVAKEVTEAGLGNRPKLLPSADAVEYAQEVKSLRPSLGKHCCDIKFVLLGVGEYSHLLVVATRNRVLIWNLLTLKIQTVLKLSCQHICIDPVSGYVAAFTNNNQLFVFPPNCPIPVYGRKRMPNVLGALWVPRKVQRTNYSDWQASSQLIFLTADQELMCFVSDADEEVLGASMAHLQGYQSLTQTPFGAMLAKQQQHQQQRHHGGLVNGGALLQKKSTAKELMNLLPHAMAPLHILCKGYLGSVLNESGGGGGGGGGLGVGKQMSSSSNSGSASRPASNGDTEDPMEVDGDSDSEVEIVTGAAENGQSNGKVASATTNGTATTSAGRESQTISLNVERQLKKMAKVELQLSV